MKSIQQTCKTAKLLKMIGFLMVLAGIFGMGNKASVPFVMGAIGGGVAVGFLGSFIGWWVNE